MPHRRKDNMTMSTENKETLHINDGLSNEEYGHDLDDSVLEATTGGRQGAFGRLTRSMSAPAGSIDNAGKGMPRPSGEMDKQSVNGLFETYVHPWKKQIDRKRMELMP
jgi:hypothetical protein